MIVVGGGSAKDEITARVGILVGHFIKRFLTIAWALTGLIAVALYAHELADPDLVWGHATVDLLGPVGLGLVGLMIVSLMAALMASASCYILVASSLLVRNLYCYLRQNCSEEHYVLVGRISSALTIIGGIFFSIYYYDVFDQLKVAWELPVIFAATVWVAMYWRRASRLAAWVSIATTALLFFIIPILLPVVHPSLRLNEKYLAVTRTKEVVRRYQAKEFDIWRRNKEIEKWKELSTAGLATTAEPQPLDHGRDDRDYHQAAIHCNLLDKGDKGVGGRDPHRPGIFQYRDGLSQHGGCRHVLAPQTDDRDPPSAFPDFPAYIAHDHNFYFYQGRGPGSSRPLLCAY